MLSGDHFGLRSIAVVATTHAHPIQFRIYLRNPAIADVLVCDGPTHSEVDGTTHAQQGASVEVAATQYSLGLVPGNFEQDCANPASWLYSRTVIADAAGIARVKFAVYPDAPSGFKSIAAIRTPSGISGPRVDIRVRLANEFTSQVGADRGSADRRLPDLARRVRRWRR